MRLIGRLESSARILALAKLANVGLAMLWGFAVTFVFVRLLPIAEFRAFLLLVAFANFTVSADFGFSSILYARLRRFRLGQGASDGFQPGDVAILLGFMTAVVGLGAALIGAGIASGHIPTHHPGLFMAFYLLSAANIFGLLVKRALAALDHNLLWELVEMARRTLVIGVLLAALAGMPLLPSVWGQLGVTVAALLFGLLLIHRDAGMRLRDWLPRPSAVRQAWPVYMHDMGSTMLLTLSDVAAYNVPYFGIGWATHDPRPLLVFDFVFKISRALTAVIRAFTEAALPRLTAAFHEGGMERARELVGRLRWLSLGAALALGAGLLVAGSVFSRVLFAGKAVLTLTELGLLAVLLLGLAMLCVSTFVHNALGRFALLLPPSIAFLVLSVASVLVARAGGASFGLWFLALYALTHVLLAIRHEALLRRLVRG